jgi:spore photoproduct lyase
MDEDLRRAERGRFARVKYVYAAAMMSELRNWFEEEVATRLPTARVLYWT